MSRLWVSAAWFLASLCVSAGVASAKVAEVPLVELMRRAVEQGEVARRLEQKLAANESSIRADQFADASRFQIQSEGFGDSLGREQNAIDYVRWVRPLIWPGALSARRDLRSAGSDWAANERSALEVDVGAGVAALWIAWCAEVSAQEVQANRLERIDRALEILRLRFDVGEVAGTELRQLEAQRVEDATVLSEHVLRARELRYQLEADLGFTAPEPDATSLSGLLSWLDELAPLPEERRDRPEPELQFARLEALTEMSTTRSRLSAARAAGDAGVSLEYEHVPSILGAPSIDAIGFQVELPLPFGRGVQARRAAARQRGASATEDLRQGRLRLERDAAVLAAREQNSRSGLEELAAVLGDLESTSSSLSEQFRLGAISYLRLLDGLGRLDDVRLRQVRLQESLLQSRVELARLTGLSAWFPLPSLEENSP